MEATATLASATRIPRVIRRNYVLGDVLSTGGYSKVHHCTDTDGLRYACKVVMKDTNAVTTDKVHREIRALRMLDSSPKITRMYDALEDSAKYYIVQELCRGGTLADYLSLDRGWGCTHAASSYGENAVASFVRGILRALCHASDMGIVHGDIKASNVLLSDKSDDAEVKLCDFGCVAFLENYSDRYMIVDKLSGTPAFMAPEMLAHKMHITSDVWGLGVLVYQMLSGRLPFCKRSNAGMHETFNSILNDKPDTSGLLWELISKDAIDFVCVCLDKCPESRPNARDLLQHPWLKSTACKDRFVGKPLPGLQAIYLQPKNEIMQSLM